VPRKTVTNLGIAVVLILSMSSALANQKPPELTCEAYLAAPTEVEGFLSNYAMITDWTSRLTRGTGASELLWSAFYSAGQLMMLGTERYEDAQKDGWEFRERVREVFGDRATQFLWTADPAAWIAEIQLDLPFQIYLALQFEGGWVRGLSLWLPKDLSEMDPQWSEALQRINRMIVENELIQSHRDYEELARELRIIR
jgi:hypothetical protein